MLEKEKYEQGTVSQGINDHSCTANSHLCSSVWCLLTNRRNKTQQYYKLINKTVLLSEDKFSDGLCSVNLSPIVCMMSIVTNLFYSDFLYLESFNIKHLCRSLSNSMCTN